MSFPPRSVANNFIPLEISYFMTLALGMVFSKTARPIPPTRFAPRLFWGLRTRTQLLHDASAITLEQAIQKHTHEAATEVQKYNQLNAPQKQLLDVFLDSL